MIMYELVAERFLDALGLRLTDIFNSSITSITRLKKP